MKYRLDVRRAAEKDMRNLPNHLLKRVTAKILSLADNPYQRGAIKIRGQSRFRARVGDYRVVYEVDDASRTLIIFGVPHRREAYR